VDVKHISAHDLEKKSKQHLNIQASALNCGPLSSAVDHHHHHHRAACLVMDALPFLRACCKLDGAQ